MNFLAHLYLSGDDPELRIGNFIGDFVKGKEIKKYPKGIQNGIVLHRKIDEYTDSHEIVLQSKIRLRPTHHHYAPVIVDVFYDHFLAKNWSNFHDQPLLQYTIDFYGLTEKYNQWLPERTTHMLYYMKNSNWLFNYQYIEGIDRALKGMSGRTPYPSKMDKATLDLKQHYHLFEAEFLSFFPKLKSESEKFITGL
jgi:acyl carrier protein phosphodiesterase